MHEFDLGGVVLTLASRWINLTSTTRFSAIVTDTFWQRHVTLTSSSFIELIQVGICRFLFLCHENVPN